MPIQASYIKVFVLGLFLLGLYIYTKRSKLMIRDEAKSILILLCGLTLLVYLGLGHFQEDVKPVLNGTFGEGFYVSLAASFIEDIIFFGIIGFAIYLTNFRKLEDESFETRLKSIANSKKVGEQARENLSKSIRELLSYNRKREIRITLKEFKPDEGYIKVHCDMKNFIRNMCKDVQHPLINANVFVEPGLEVKESFGYISFLQIRDAENETNKKTIVNKDIIELQRSTYRQEVSFSIAEDGEAIWDLSFTIYNELGNDKSDPDNWFYCTSTRFTQDLTVTLINEVDSVPEIGFDLEFNNRNTGQDIPVVLNDNVIHRSETRQLLSNVSQQKRDKIKIFFKTSV